MLTSIVNMGFNIYNLPGLRRQQATTTTTKKKLLILQYHMTADIIATFAGTHKCFEKPMTDPTNDSHRVQITPSGVYML